ncbi:hypothetical protein [Flagellimonas meridianipacifica]|uniref:Uncharacterized protein n=1 Tax=Flagellimonas meridianipacifica TaxID=1080225 RepID=A0A2T0MI68_9FLAO|nr:hypothetical protein [Allomuricauda pacifica]PRX57282.1 hypothetical protein CLV81_1285 [Allomuricauda pacifica]
MTNSEFEKQFEAGILPPELFTHEAHIRLAWIHITQYGIDKAISNIVNQIQGYTTKLGVPDKFNKTLTIAAVRAVYHFMLKSNCSDFQSFIIENPRLKFNFKDLMASHYGFDIYTSLEAKKNFLEPDLLPFD